MTYHMPPHRLSFARLARRAGALAVVAVLAACGSKVELFTDLREAEANDVLAALQNAGIAGSKQVKKDGASVTVTAADLARAVNVLQANGLPRDPHVTFGDVFKKEGLISSPTEERARYIYAVSQELSYTLSKIDGVLAARVHLALPEQATREGAPEFPSAAVFIKYRSDAPLDTLQPQMRRLITNSIPRLAPEKVSFILVPGTPATQAKAPRATAPDTPTWLGLALTPESLRMLALGCGAAILAAVAACAGAFYFVRRRQSDPATAESRNAVPRP